MNVEELKAFRADVESDVSNVYARAPTGVVNAAAKAYCKQIGRGTFSNKSIEQKREMWNGCAVAIVAAINFRIDSISTP